MIQERFHYTNRNDPANIQKQINIRESAFFIPHAETIEGLKRQTPHRLSGSELTEKHIFSFLLIRYMLYSLLAIDLVFSRIRKNG